MDSQNCLFCKIVRGEIPNYTVFEDEHVLAFLDIHPCSKGHTVVIPKKHYENIWEINLETSGVLGTSLRAAAGRVQARLKPNGMNIGINNEPAAGQAVPHAHWHIIPRYDGDGGGSMHSIVRTKQDVDVAAVAEMFK